jgi:hypothetical protein
MDIFTYTVSDDKGKLDRSIVSVRVKAATDSKTPDQTKNEIKNSQERQVVQQGDKALMNDLTDNNQGTDPTLQSIEKSGSTLLADKPIPHLNNYRKAILQENGKSSFLI